MTLKNFFIICSNILFSKNIILINSPLQFLNFIEFEDFEKRKKVKYNCIFLGYLNESEIRIIRNINKRIYFKNYIIIPFKKNINVKFLNYIIKIRKFFLKKIKTFIFGDYNYYLNREFYKISKFKIMLDDGNNSLLFSERFNLSKKKLKIFSIYSKSVFQKSKVIKNNFLFLKKNISKHKIFDKNLNYFIGSPFVECGILTKKQYMFLINKIIKIFRGRRFVYIPHPRESKKNYSNYSFTDIVENNSTFELFLAKEKFLPNSVVGFNSTLFVTLKKIFSNNLKLIPFFFEVNSKFELPNYNRSKHVFKSVKNYLESIGFNEIKKITINFV